MDKKILRLAVPSLVSNITVPLLGLADVAIVGHLGAASYIGAIAVGGMLFSMVYWLFGFLRMGTSGLTSQAYGAHDLAEAVGVLARSLLVGLLMGSVLVAFQMPLRWLAFRCMEMSDDVRSLAQAYFHICVWGAPAVLGLYGLNGWFVGMQNARLPMWVAIVQNVLNIAASLCLVYGFGMKVEGVAWGTLVAQYGGFLLALALAFRFYGRLWGRFRLASVWHGGALRRFFRINRDIFLRTLCLVAVSVFFTSGGARQGDMVLATNTLLMQFFTFFSYVMDGFAYAGEALSGRYVGAFDVGLLKCCVRRLFRWGLGLAVFFSLLYISGGETIIGLLTDDSDVLRTAHDYLGWVWLIPFAGFAAFLWDGIFIGATASRQMLQSMWVASVVFFACFFALRGWWGNHALWFAFVAYLAVRGVMQAWLSRSIYTMITRSPHRLARQL